METLMTAAVMLLLLLIVESSPESSYLVVMGMRAALVLTVIHHLWIVLSNWLDSRRVFLEPEPEKPKESWVELEGRVRLDPVHGVYGTVIIDGVIHRVVIQPDYYPYLPAVLKDEAEAAVLTSPVSSVQPGKEPGSLVCIQDAMGTVVGMGVRVHCGSSTVLLTSYHVLKVGQLSDLYLAKYSAAEKRGLRVQLERSWDVEYASKDPETDVIAVRVPDMVWSKLGVKTSKIGTLRGRMPVVVYGADSCAKFYSSTGAVEHKGGFELRHSCSTTKGWSGAPLFFQDQVVGIHRRYEEIGRSNLATLVKPFHHATESSESEGEVVREVEEEEAGYRDGDWFDTTIIGRGKFSTLEKEYTVRPGEMEHQLALNKRLKKGGKSWADLVEDDEWEWDNSLEAAMPLNCQEAVSACSPPCSTCPESSGEVDESSRQPECPSLSVENRLSNLEKLFELQLLQGAEMQRSISLLSESLVGLSAAPKPSLTACSSKQDVSERPKPPQTSGEPSTSSLRSIPESDSVPASVGKAGSPRKSKGKSKKSRSPKA